MAITSWPAAASASRRTRRAERSDARDADDGDVGIAVLADEVGGALAAVGQRDVDRGRAVDDVAVGEDEAVGREDEARAAARLRARAPGGARRADVDADDGGCDALDGVDDGARIRVEELVVRGLVFVAGRPIPIRTCRRRRPVRVRAKLTDPGAAGFRPEPGFPRGRAPARGRSARPWRPGGRGWSP